MRKTNKIPIVHRNFSMAYYGYGAVPTAETRHKGGDFTVSRCFGRGWWLYVRDVSDKYRMMSKRRD